jgi:MYND finger
MSLSQYTTTKVKIVPDPSLLDKILAKQPKKYPLPLGDVPFPKDCTRLALSITDITSRQIFERIMKGDNIVVVVSENDKRLIMEYSLVHNNEEIEGFQIVNFEGLGKVASTSSTSGMKTKHVDFPQNICNVASHRVVHWVVRQHLSRFRGPITKQRMFKYLMTYYGDNNQWKDAYDISTLHCKWVLMEYPIGVSPEPNIYRSYSIATVAYGLEALQKYEQAGILCREASKSLSRQAFVESSGFAFRQCSQYEEAERLYLDYFRLQLHQSLISPAFVNPNEESLSATFRSLVSLYFEWVAEHIGCTANISSDHNEFMVVYRLLALLHVAGWNEWATFKSATTVDETEFLKSEFLNKQTAWERLCRAFSCRDPVDYRRLILDTQDPRVVIEFNHTKEDYEILKWDRKKNKNNSRVFFQRALGATDLARCAHCAVELGKYRSCPCRKVQYCGKKCQFAHWKAEHKNTCSIPREKK